MTIETTTALVQEILTSNPETRNNDNLLFFLVCKKVLDVKGIDIESFSFKKLFLSLKEYGLPQFETVGRARRKLQQKNPELCCKESIAEARSANRDAFNDFAHDERM